MKLFILRHGDAEVYASSDDKRQLTIQGQQNVTETARKYTKELSAVSNILVSPYVRAQQTADIVLSNLSLEHSSQEHSSQEHAAQGHDFSVSTVDFLTPNIQPQTVINALFTIQGQVPDHNILLVSHQPLVGYLIELFCQRKPNFMGGYSMPPASMACLQMDVIAAGCAELVFLHNP